MTTISLRLPDSLLSLLEREARSRGVSKSRLLRESLEQSLQRPPKAGAASCYDLARDLDGVVKGLPRDLATHPKHMKGFGR